MGYALGGNSHGLAAAGIAPHAWGAVVDGEAAKAAHLNAVPAYQGFADSVEQCLDGEFGIAVRELAKTGGKIGKVSFGGVSGTGPVSPSHPRRKLAESFWANLFREQRKADS